MARRRWRPPARRLDGAARAAPGGHFHCLAATGSRRGPSHGRNAGAFCTALALRRRIQRDIAIRGWAQRSRPTTGRRSNSPGRLPSSPVSRPITPPRSAVCSTEGNKPSAVARALTGATASQWRDRGAMLMDADAADSAYRDYATALDLDPTDMTTLEGFVRAATAARQEDDAERRLRAMIQSRGGPSRRRGSRSRNFWDAWAIRRSDSGRNRSHQARARRSHGMGAACVSACGPRRCSFVYDKQRRCCDASSQTAPQAGTSQPASASCGATCRRTSTRAPRHRVGRELR